MSKLISTIVAVLLLGSCTQNYYATRSWDRPQIHPEFYSHGQDDESYSYQISMHRSWRPSVYVVAESNGEAAKVGYSISKGKIEPLHFKKITQQQWNEIQEAYIKTAFEELSEPCWEEAYDQDYRLLHQSEDSQACEEIVMTDGGILSMRAVTPAINKAVTMPLLSDNLPPVVLADKILSIAGVKESRVPKYGK